MRKPSPRAPRTWGEESTGWEEAADRQRGLGIIDVIFGGTRWAISTMWSVIWALKGFFSYARDAR